MNHILDTPAPTFTEGTWDDPKLHPVAVARLDRVTIGRFALDHEKQTARLLSTGCAEIRGTGEYIGVTAEVEPFAARHHPLALPGKELVLMSHPFNGRTVYTITNELDGRR